MDDGSGKTGDDETTQTHANPYTEYFQLGYCHLACMVYYGTAQNSVAKISWVLSNQPAKHKNNVLLGHPIDACMKGSNTTGHESKPVSAFMVPFCEMGVSTANVNPTKDDIISDLTECTFFSVAQRCNSNAKPDKTFQDIFGVIMIPASTWALLIYARFKSDASSVLQACLDIERAKNYLTSKWKIPDNFFWFKGGLIMQKLSESVKAHYKNARDIIGTCTSFLQNHALEEKMLQALEDKIYDETDHGKGRTVPVYLHTLKARLATGMLTPENVRGLIQYFNTNFNFVALDWDPTLRLLNWAMFENTLSHTPCPDAKWDLVQNFRNTTIIPKLAKKHRKQDVYILRVCLTQHELDMGMQSLLSKPQDLAALNEYFCLFVTYTLENRGSMQFYATSVPLKDAVWTTYYEQQTEKCHVIHFHAACILLEAMSIRSFWSDFSIAMLWLNKENKLQIMAEQVKHTLQEDCDFEHAPEDFVTDLAQNIVDFIRNFALPLDTAVALTPIAKNPFWDWKDWYNMQYRPVSGVVKAAIGLPNPYMISSQSGTEVDPLHASRVQHANAAGSGKAIDLDEHGSLPRSKDRDTPPTPPPNDTLTRERLEQVDIDSPKPSDGTISHPEASKLHEGSGAAPENEQAATGGKRRRPANASLLDNEAALGKADAASHGTNIDAHASELDGGSDAAPREAQAATGGKRRRPDNSSVHDNGAALLEGAASHGVSVSKNGAATVAAAGAASGGQPLEAAAPRPDRDSGAELYDKGLDKDSSQANLHEGAGAVNEDEDDMPVLGSDFTDKEMADYGFHIMPPKVMRMVFKSVVNTWDANGLVRKTCDYREDQPGSHDPTKLVFDQGLTFNTQQHHLILAEYLTKHCAHVPAFPGPPNATKDSYDSRAVATSAVYCGSWFPKDCPMRRQRIQAQRETWRTGKTSNKNKAYEFFANAIGWDIARQMRAEGKTAPDVPERYSDESVALYGVSNGDA